MNDSIFQRKEKTEGNPATTGKSAIDPFEEFYRQIEKKYAEILSGDDPYEYATDISNIWDKIFNYDLTTQELDHFLIELNEDASKPLVIADVKAAIAERIGDMLETYRYESTEEGQAIESYIDQLLTIVHKYERDTQIKNVTAVPISRQLTHIKEGPKAGRRKPQQDMLFS